MSRVYKKLESEYKDRMQLWVTSQVIKMDQHCKRKGITNVEISKNCGLPACYISLFRRRKRSEMTIVNFLLIAKAIGYEFEFNLKTQ